ncbi:MAG TPA: hypothetical protein VEU32_09295 [Burkholderiales bacterium]|nr:hypothetical protein [Burkholderiales bacterium]
MRAYRILPFLLVAGCSQQPAERPAPRVAPGPTLNLSQEPRRPAWNWAMAGGTQERFNRDNTECYGRDSSLAETAPGERAQRIIACMESKGYRRVPTE